MNLGKITDYLKSKIGWSKGANGNDKYGFYAILAGHYNGYGVKEYGRSAYFWTSENYIGVDYYVYIFLTAQG